MDLRSHLLTELLQLFLRDEYLPDDLGRRLSSERLNEVVAVAVHATAGLVPSLCQLRLRDVLEAEEHQRHRVTGEEELVVLVEETERVVRPRDDLERVAQGQPVLQLPWELPLEREPEVACEPSRLRLLVKSERAQDEHVALSLVEPVQVLLDLFADAVTLERLDLLRGEAALEALDGELHQADPLFDDVVHRRFVEKHPLRE